MSSPPPSSPNHMLKTFNDANFSDCEVHVEEKIFKVNKIFLCEHSEVFEAFFKYDTKERQTNVIKIDEATPEIVEIMLKWMYSMEVENLDKIVKDLYVLADRYNVKNLMKKCLDYLCENLFLYNIFDCFSFIISHDLPKLEQKVYVFTLKNMCAIMKRDEWSEFSFEHHDFAQELIMKWAEKMEKEKLYLQNSVAKVSKENVTLRNRNLDLIRKAHPTELIERIRNL